MHIKVISQRDEIFILNPGERIVHIAFRPSNKDIFALVEACPKLEAIQLPPSYFRTLAKTVEMFCTMQKIQLLEGDVWGFRKDLCEHMEISPDLLERIAELKKDNVPEHAIAEELKRKSGVSPGMLNFVIGKVKA